MDTLRAEFEALGFAEVSTFIASGNVIFEAAGKAAPLELKIEGQLAQQLGYPVPTFVRTATVVVKIAAREPFGRSRQATPTQSGSCGRRRPPRRGRRPRR